MDRLRRSLEQVETPICPNCHIEMKWYRSTLEASDTISHMFACPNCNRTRETKSIMKAAPPVPPEKLSAPTIDGPPQGVSVIATLPVGTSRHVAPPNDLGR
jgi:hypothetical protein